MDKSRLVDVLNGPNLNLLGQRPPGIDGHETEAASRPPTADEAA